MVPVPDDKDSEKATKKCPRRSKVYHVATRQFTGSQKATQSHKLTTTLKHASAMHLNALFTKGSKQLMLGWMVAAACVNQQHDALYGGMRYGCRVRAGCGMQGGCRGGGVQGSLDCSLAIATHRRSEWRRRQQRYAGRHDTNGAAGSPSQPEQRRTQQSTYPTDSASTAHIQLKMCRQQSIAAGRRHGLNYGAEGKCDGTDSESYK